LDLTGYWPADIAGRPYTGSSSTAVGVPVTAAIDFTAQHRPSAVELAPAPRPRRGHPLACRTGTVDSQYASMSTTTTTSTASDDDVDDDVTPSPDDVIQFVESPV